MKTDRRQIKHRLIEMIAKTRLNLLNRKFCTFFSLFRTRVFWQHNNTVSCYSVVQAQSISLAVPELRVISDYFQQLKSWEERGRVGMWSHQTAEGTLQAMPRSGLIITQQPHTLKNPGPHAVLSLYYCRTTAHWLRSNTLWVNGSTNKLKKQMACSLCD